MLAIRKFFPNSKAPVRPSPGQNQHLPDLGHEDLRKRWKLLFGRPAPKSLRRKFMARAVA
jgi:hypothetical protein